MKATSVKPLLLLPIAVVLVEVALRFMSGGFMVRTLHGRMAEIVSLPAPRVQIMGDSVSAAINSANLAEAAGLPVAAVDNYSLPGTSPVFAYYALRRELAAGRTPEEILYAPHPANLETPMIDRFIGRFGTLEECGELIPHRVTATRNSSRFRIATLTRQAMPKSQSGRVTPWASSSALSWSVAKRPMNRSIIGVSRLAGYGAKRMTDGTRPAVSSRRSVK